MSARRGNKRGQKAAEAPADVLLEQPDVGPNLRIDHHEQFAAVSSPDQMHATPDAAFGHIPAASGPDWRHRLRKLRPALSQLLLCMLLGLCVFLTLHTHQLAATVSSQQAALAELQRDLASERSLLKHAGLRSVVKSLERQDKRLGGLEAAAANATAAASAAPAAASTADLQLLQDTLLNETRAQCSACQSACTAHAVQQLQQLHSQHQAAVSQTRTTQLNTTTLLPAVVIRHSPPASPSSIPIAFAIADRLKSALLHLNVHPVHPQATTYLQQTFPLPSRCLPLRGSSGYVDLQLPAGSLVTSLSIQHPWNRTQSAASAPKQFSLHVVEPHLLGWKEQRRLGTWQYLVPGPELQVFDLQQPAALTMVRVRVVSNYGSAKLTCLYSLQFHGTLHDTAAVQ